MAISSAVLHRYCTSSQGLVLFSALSSLLVGCILYSVAMSKDNGKPLVGSCHKFSDGYGYGQRYLTSRNAPTLPCSVPVLRHPPLSERYLRVTAPTKLIATDMRAEKRNADQIMLQTSGEVGRFYVDPEPEAVKLGRTLLKPTVRLGSTFEPSQSEFSKPATTRSNDMSGKMESCRTGRSTDRSSLGENTSRFINESNNIAGFTNTSTYVSTLQNLDKTFSNVNRRDLFAASLPGRPAQELVWCAANNNRGAQATKTWAERLRKESVQSSSGY